MHLCNSLNSDKLPHPAFHRDRILLVQKCSEYKKFLVFTLYFQYLPPYCYSGVRKCLTPAYSYSVYIVFKTDACVKNFAGTKNIARGLECLNVFLQSDVQSFCCSFGRPKMPFKGDKA